MIDFILVRGGTKIAPRVASQSRWKYGIRNDYTPYDDVYMLDILWENYDWIAYLELVQQLRPTIAMVADYIHPRQRRQMLSQIEDLRHKVDVIACCPKFAGAAHHIPNDVRLAISIPTTYAGYLPPILDIWNREVHLLGGNPHRQLSYAMTAKTVNAKVKSIDGNYHIRKAGLGQYFMDGRWVQVRGHIISDEELAILSGIHIRTWFVNNYQSISTPLLF